MTYQGTPFRTHWAANDDYKELTPVKIHLTDEGELPESPGSVTFDIKTLNANWLNPIRHEVAVRLREWCTNSYGPESTTSWRLMNSGFVFFAHRSDGMMFWVAWHHVDMQL